jgi:Tfp pilus assembly protein PilO
MMDHCGPSEELSNWQWLVQQFFNLLIALFTAWLVHRRYLADKREAERNGTTDEEIRKNP